MKIVQEREFRVIVNHDLVFDGYAFPCDENGNVDESTLEPAGLENYKACIAKGNGYVESYENSYTIPAIGECSCGNEVILDSFTNTCDKCGADYNSSGQRLADRSQWGYETGEHWTDCI